LKPHSVIKISTFEFKHMDEIERDNFTKTRQAYASNKVRKQERWFDWTESNGEALDGLIRKRRGVDPVPYDISSRSPTPKDKRYDYDQAFASTAYEYSATREVAKQVQLKSRYRPTSIFGGQQMLPGSPGKGWRTPHFNDAPPAEINRNKKLEKKYEGSSFPSKYDEFCAKEHKRMNRRAVGQG
jgi:hypothetical protein